MPSSLAGCDTHESRSGQLLAVAVQSHLIAVGWPGVLFLRRDPFPPGRNTDDVPEVVEASRSNTVVAVTLALGSAWPASPQHFQTHTSVQHFGERCWNRFLKL